MRNAPLALLAFGLGNQFAPATPASYVYTPLDFPGAVGTFPIDINDAGAVVGEFSPSRGNASAFIYFGGVFTEIQIPNASTSRAEGINKHGVVVGEYTDMNQRERGFIYNRGTVTTYDLNLPDVTRTILTGIDDSGRLLGQYDDGSHNLYGFIDAAGVITRLLHNGILVPSFANGINNSGEVVGTYRPIPGSNRGFIWSDGVFQTVPLPIDREHQAWDINDAGNIVGSYSSSSGESRFGCLLSGGYILASFGTILTGVNNYDTAVGVFVDRSGGFQTTRGFMVETDPLYVQIRGPSITGSVTISWNSRINKQYQVQCATTLTNAWSDLGSPVQGTGKNSVLHSIVDGGPVRFYRVVRVP